MNAHDNYDVSLTLESKDQRWRSLGAKNTLFTIKWTRCRALTGRNCTVPPCSVGCRTSHAPGPAAYRPRALQTTPTEDSVQNNTGPLGGPVLNQFVCLWMCVCLCSGFNFTSSSRDDVDTFQRIVETFKFGYAERTYLGDEMFTNVSEVPRFCFGELAWREQRPFYQWWM